MQSRLESLRAQIDQFTADINRTTEQIKAAQGSTVTDAPLRVRLRTLLAQRDKAVQRMDEEKLRGKRLAPKTNKRRKK